MAEHACRKILASTVAKLYINDLAARAASLPSPPRLVALLANRDPAAKTYADWTAKTAQEIGFLFDLKVIEDKDDIEENITQLNDDESVHGIIVYMPVFGNKQVHIAFPPGLQQDQYILNCLSPEKDVEGLSHLYLHNMYHNIRYLDKEQKTKSILPCTPLGIVKVLEYIQIYNPLLHYGNRLYGKTILIVNRSEVVGRPLAALLANDGATVYSLDLTGMQLFTRGAGIKLRKHHVTDVSIPLSEVAPKCDVIITGVPNPAYKFPTNLIRDGAVCICFSSYKNFEDDIEERASIYVPSIGKVTIAMLCRNQLRLIKNSKIHS